ncbi:hypothetical protein BP5796_06442 [Coleophoma crateriformis]|uniref:DUF6546 domain-containing protein n=1 Tax=Coleophoma crateriformis TaxID=565419 RepID=A0A3D8RP85_9HELO|nr:hypothetical protein BP5796_06442 [Coleophoma crateriformis]
MAETLQGTTSSRPVLKVLSLSSSLITGHSIIASTILKLFSILSTWQPTGCLILELSAYSPSDSEHWFKNYHSGLEHEDVGDLIQQQEATTRWHDPKHGWVNGQQVEAPRAPAILRLFSPICLSLPKNLPEVHAVTGFMIRRQLRLYEPWRVWRRSWKILCDKELASVIQDALPSHVRTVSISEEFNDQLALILRRDTPYLRIIDTNPSAGLLTLVRAFASKSRNFERLSISYMIDAQQFSILTQTAPQKEISALLYDASLAALNMPQLESMVFWNSKHGEACAVIYQRNKASRNATLTWRGTWDLELGYDVV